MIISKYFMTREDGVKLYRTIDAVVDENGEPVLDENGELIPTGLMIHKIGTEEYYSEAIDVEGAPFTYEETDIPVDPVEPEESPEGELDPDKI